MTGTYGLVLLRCSAFFAAFPMALGLGVPAFWRAGAAALFALALLPLAGKPVVHGPAAALGELVLGLGLGFCLRLPVLAAQSAGELLGFSTQASSLMMPGLPEEPGQGPSGWGLLYLLLGLMVFFSLGGLEAALGSIASSLRAVPVGSAWLSVGADPLDLGRLMAQVVGWAWVLCLPPLLASLLSQWALGVVFKASAQLQMFAFALPIASLAAAVTLCLALPTWPALLGRALGGSLQAGEAWVLSLGR